jgi:putative endonuclease
MVGKDAFIAVYMMTNRKHGTLYPGVTSQLIQRVGQHREGGIPGFTKTHGLKRLVWFEAHEDMVFAIHREKLLKKYRRGWKTNLIERDNPHWDDLYLSIIG